MLGKRLLPFLDAVSVIPSGHVDDVIVVAKPPTVVTNRATGSIILRLTEDGVIAELSGVEAVYEHVLRVALRYYKA